MSRQKLVRVGVIGAGHWGPNIIRNFMVNSNSEVIAVADKLEARLEIIRERCPGVEVTLSADEVILRPDIDAVVICTPTATHFDLAKRALEQGKHVFVEKPLATNVKDCEVLVDLAREVRRTLFVGHVFVYSASIQAVKEILMKKELGKIHYVTARRTNLGPIRYDVSSLWDLAPHDIAILKYWFDEMPTQVSAIGGCYLNDKLQDAVFATYGFESGILANLHVSWLSPKKIREIVIVGEEKMLIWDDMDLNYPIRIFDKKIVMTKGSEFVDTFASFRANVVEGDTTYPRVVMNEPLAAECGAFLSAIDNPSLSMSSGEDGRDVVRAICAAEVSLKERGREIAITCSSNMRGA